MAVLLTNGSVFLHIPKTGGTWVRHVLGELNSIRRDIGPEHADWDRAFWYGHMQEKPRVVRYLLRRLIGSARTPKLEPTCFRFCFVREPLGWYESWWRFMESRDWPEWGSESSPYKWHPTAMLNGLRSSDFNDFVRKVNRKRPGFVTEMYGWYVRPGIDFVGKMETLEKDFRKVLQLMGTDLSQAPACSAPPQNKTEECITRPAWDPEVRRETYQLEYAAYVRFGYEKPVCLVEQEA